MIGGAKRIGIGDRGPVLVSPDEGLTALQAGTSFSVSTADSTMDVATSRVADDRQEVVIGSHFCDDGASKHELAVECVRSQARRHGRPLPESEMGFSAYRKRSLERGIFVEPVAGEPDAGTS